MEGSLDDLLAEFIHEKGEGHDPENFRGCTHPDCVRARKAMSNEKARANKWRGISENLQAEYSDVYKQYDRDTSYRYLLAEFYKEWDAKAHRGEVSPIDRAEGMILDIFVKWMESKKVERSTIR